ncbi:MAG: hypothetical protein KFF50_07030 [Desulfatitalea sp.]|nr:hypothetical protein [Desulfatitalea sp.]
MRRHYASKLFILILLMILAMHLGCVETKRLVEKPATASCVACHTDYHALQALADPDTDPPVEGCGGAAPHIAPHDRVFLGGPGYDAFLNSEHGRLACTDCHGGVDGTADKRQAHSGDFIKHPSLNAQASCGDCHDDIVRNAAGSLHEQGWGQKNAVALRMGVATFDALPQTIQAAYGQNCATCHGSCGDCHVNRPKASGGGLYKGHQFSRTPDMRDNCVACHSSRGGHAYFGLGIGAEPDVHLSQAGFTCLDCHSQQQIHGDGQIYAHRFKAALSPQCQDCHADLADSNPYHEAHVADFACHLCHSQDYNNCGSCHVGGHGARIPSHLTYKIGLNPIPDDKPYKFALLRRTLAAPDSWEKFGVARMPNFDAKTTFNYTTPHNILLWTTRTRVAAGGSCFDSCHLVGDGTETRNRELYLFATDLKESWEKSANKHIVVDGQLPDGWEKN